MELGVDVARGSSGDASAERRELRVEYAGIRVGYLRYCSFCAGLERLRLHGGGVTGRHPLCVIPAAGPRVRVECGETNHMNCVTTAHPARLDPR